MLAVGIVAALMPVGLAVADTQAGGSGPPASALVTGADFSAAGPPDRTVTLITGDRVGVVERAGRLHPVGIEPGPGRVAVAFTANATGGHLRVVPSDAMPLLRAGQLDPRLFDVTALVDFGYDDARRADLPLIVTGDTTRTRTSANALSGVKELRTVPGGTAFQVTKHGIEAAWQALSGGARTKGLSKVWLDGLRKPLLTDSVPQVGAPAAWAAGFTGAGVKVGVVDSGVDASHPDLAGRVVAARNFVEDGDSRDLTGHGTHVAATIAGVGAGGTYRGVAPDAQLLSARACNMSGCPDSAVLAGMQWVADQGAKVINMSLGGADTPDRDPLEDAVERITAESGALFVIAAGNDGELGESTIGSPGSADSALTVGAVNKHDELADFSSRGPRLGDDALKPDITAPGVDIVAAKSKDAPGDPAVSRVAKSGTSMATPHVAGAAAILAQRHPGWTAAQLKAALMGSARTNPEISVYAQGAGRLDIARGIQQAVLADPPSVSVQDLWPREQQPTTRTITYRNTGTDPVTLALDMRTTAPAGLFAVSNRTLTVPAGGTASVDVTVHTGLPGAATRNTGYLVATEGERMVTTPVVAAVDLEEHHDLSLTHLGLDGGTPKYFTTAVVDVEHDRAIEVTTPAARLHLPVGRYAIMTIFQPTESSPITILVTPVVVLDQDRSITIDARSARRPSVRLPVPGAKEFYTSTYTTATGPAGMSYSIFASSQSFDGLRIGPVGEVQSDPAIESGFSAMFGKQGVNPEDSPFLANVAWQERGRMFPGVDKNVNFGDLAVVQAEYARHRLPAGTAEYDMVWPGSTFPLSHRVPVRLPSSRVEYHNTDGDIRHVFSLEEGDVSEGFGNLLTSPLRTLHGRQLYHERRNRAVYGPGFTDPPPRDNGWVLRRGDTMRLRPRLLNDGLNWAGFPTGKPPVLTLDRDGTRIFSKSGNASDVNVPSGTATYRLGADLVRDEQLSTRVTCEWTFRSGSVGNDAFTPLPLSVVRFQPELNLNNAAPAGTQYGFPIEIQRQPGSAAEKAREVTVEVSYDDGATWQAARVTRFNQLAVVVVNHPAGPGFVSLRASSEDSAGNTVKETIIRAYRIE